METEGLPEKVAAMLRRLRELHPEAALEAEPAYFVRAYEGSICVDARTVKL